MATDEKITQIPLESAPTRDDYAVTVNAPAGVPETRRTPWGTLIDALLAIIATSLLPDTDATYNLGSAALKWLQAFLNRITFEEGGSDTTPATGDVAMYAKADGKIYSKDDNGDEILVSGGDASGAGVGRKTVSIPASAMSPATTNGCGTLEQIEGTAGRAEIFGLPFDPTTAEIALVEFPMPKGWDGGNIRVKFYWTTEADVTTNAVVWGAAAQTQGDGDPIDAIFGTQIKVTDANQSTAKDSLSTSETADISAGSPGDNDMLVLQIERVTGDGGDTLTVDAILRSIQIYYDVDSSTDD